MSSIFFWRRWYGLSEHTGLGVYRQAGMVSLFCLTEWSWVEVNIWGILLGVF